MPLLFLGLVEHRGWRAAPRILVTCTECGDVYVVAVWPSRLVGDRAPRGCSTCAHARPAKRKKTAKRARRPR